MLFRSSRVYVANNVGGTISIIDGTTNTVSANVTVGTNPAGVAINKVTDTIYVSNSSDGTLSVINGSTNAVSATINVGSGPDGVAVNEATNTIYVSNSSDGTLSVINGSTNAVSATIPVGTHTFAIAVNPSNGIIYTANDTPGILYIVSLDSDSQILSPLQQVHTGVKPTQVTCHSGLELVLKQSNGDPVCVKPNNLEKLLSRGWAIRI